MGAETLVYIKLNGENMISKINSMDQFEQVKKWNLVLTSIKFISLIRKQNCGTNEGEVQIDQKKKRIVDSMRVELFQQDFKINASAHQAHLIYRVHVPEHVAEIEVRFTYGPILETDKENIRKAVVREGLQNR